MSVHALALLILCLALAGCDRKKKIVNSEKVDPPAGDLPVEGTVVRSGSVKLPAGAALRPGELQVVSAFEETTPDADGSFDVRVAETSKPQFVFSLDPETGNPVLVGYTGAAAGDALDLSFESTAVSLAFLSPIMMGTAAEHRRAFIEAVKAHPDFPRLVAAIEAAFRADPRRLLDPEVNPEIYQQAADLSIGAWEGIGAAGKLAFRDQVPEINDGTGKAITFVNPMFVYYVARIATADQSFANQSLALVTVDPVPQKLDLSLRGIIKLISIEDGKIDVNFNSLRVLPSRQDYALDDGHFEIYLTKGFSGIDNSMKTANGRATLLNVSRAIILVLDVGTSLAPSVPDIAAELDLGEEKDVLDLLDAIDQRDLPKGVGALINIVHDQADVIATIPNSSLKDVFVATLSDLMGRIMGIAPENWKLLKIITVGGKMLNEGVPFVVDLIFAPGEVQYELVHNGALLTTLRRQEPGDPLSGAGMEREEMFTLASGTEMEMVWVPEPVSGGFWLGKHEVTQGQWEAVMGTRTHPWNITTPQTQPPSETSNYLAKGNSYPAVGISWRDAHDFIGTLNAAAGDSLYRLPTGKEWEYACRAGTETAWSFGGDVFELIHFAWYNANAGDPPKSSR